MQQRKDKDTNTEDRPQAVEPSKISGIVGGYGVLYSVKADGFLFSKARDGTDSARKTLEQDRNLAVIQQANIAHLRKQLNGTTSFLTAERSSKVVPR